MAKKTIRNTRNAGIGCPLWIPIIGVCPLYLEIGRFLQTDPIGYLGGMGLYAYCGNNPLVFADPSGLYDNKYPYPHPDDPNWYLETGRMMILPWRLDPEELSTIQDLTAYIEAYQAAMQWIGRFGFGVNIKNRDWLKFIGDATDPYGAIADLYIEALKGFVNATEALACLDQSMWRAFIEIQGYEYVRGGEKTDDLGFTLDENGDRIIRKMGDPYWTEVVLLDGYNGLGYESAKQAAAAAVKGICFWRPYHGGCPVPESWWTKSNDYLRHDSIYTPGAFRYKGSVSECQPGSYGI